MWTTLTTDNYPLAERCLALLRQMHSSYRRLTIDKMFGYMTTLSGRVFVYEDALVSCLIVIIPNRKRGLHRVLTGGYVGALSPSAMLDIVVPKLLQFMQNEHVTAIYGIRPLRMDYQPFTELLDLFPLRPEFHVTTEETMVDRVAWRIELATVPA